MKLSDYIVSYFESQGVTIIFGYIGGMVTHLIDSIALNKNMRFVQTYHEQTAAIAAEGYAKEAGKFGVAISTSGPGATNMITGIADAYFDSVPVIYVTGQVNTYEYKYTKPVRQQGFQETDVVSITKPITKYAKLIDKAEDIRYELEKAVYIATHGRKGPVLLDIPMDIQRAEIDIDKLRIYYIPTKEANKLWDVENIKQQIEHANYPMLLLGAGCASNRAKKEIEIFINNTNIPVVTSLMGRGTIDETYPNYIGMIGSYGNRCANMSIAKVDLLIALGTRLDTRQTGAMIKEFIPNGKIIHVDIDIDELSNHRLSNRIKVCEDVAAFIHKLNHIMIKSKKYDSWNTFLHTLKEKYSQTIEIEKVIKNKAPYRFMHKLNELTKENDYIVTDIGNNQMWAAQTIKLKSKQKFFTSGGLAPMGFSLPAAIGISFANPNVTIYSINGDGGFHIALQSLMIVSQYDLPIKIIIMNNNALGMITQFQGLYFEGRMPATTHQGGYRVPNIEDLAKAYSIKYYKITQEDLYNEEIITAIEKQKNCLIEFIIDGLTTVSPKLEFNSPIYRPTPDIDDY
jgi:acetolactate synthase-1/2/3 large subunit